MSISSSLVHMSYRRGVKISIVISTRYRITYPSMSREIITIQGFRTVVHFFLFFFLELTNVDTIKHFFKFLTIHFDRFFSVFPSKHNGSLFIYRTLIKKIKFIHVRFHEFFGKHWNLNFHFTQLQLCESTAYNWVILLSRRISLKKGRVTREVPRAQLSLLLA